MCLSIPGKVTEISEGKFTVDYGSEKRISEMSLVDDLKVGDYCIISNKIIVTKVDEERADKFLEMIK